MNRGSNWGREIVRNFDCIVKRKCISGPRIGHECIKCCRVFKRKHVRWFEQGWLCRDRCERQSRGLP